MSTGTAGMRRAGRPTKTGGGGGNGCRVDGPLRPPAPTDRFAGVVGGPRSVAFTLALMRTLVILPTFNEAATIEEVVRRSRHALPDAEILVIDDGSPDGTAALAEKVGEELGRVHLLRRERRLGLGNAYRAGF